MIRAMERETKEVNGRIYTVVGWMKGDAPVGTILGPTDTNENLVVIDRNPRARRIQLGLAQMQDYFEAAKRNDPQSVTEHKMLQRNRKFRSEFENEYGYKSQ